MCANALLYNQKRSRVHKTANAMLRQGRKLLHDNEAAFIRALLSLNPKAVAQAPVAALGPLANGGSASVPAPNGPAAAVAAACQRAPHKAPQKAIPQKAGMRSPPKPQPPRKGPPPKKSRLAQHLLSGEL